jgi:hypothetical protein
MTLIDSVAPIPQRILRSISQLDGKGQFAYSLWRLPEGEDFDDVDPSKVGTYLQCAGSADRLTIEWRQQLDTGEVRHFTVGRVMPDSWHPVGEEIQFAEHGVFVFANEEFEFREASGIFYFFYEHDVVPSKYVLRPL